MQPHRRQSTRFPCPWDSPGKNRGVGCHFLLQCMKVKSESKVTQSCPTLHNPMDWSLPGSSVHGIFHARVLEWVVIAFSIFPILLFSSIALWMWLVIEASSNAVRAVLHRNLECQVHESRQTESGQTGDGKSERRHSRNQWTKMRNQQTKMDWNGWI